MSRSTETEPTVFVVDDDAAVRDSLRLLIESVGLRVETFADAREFLEGYDADRPGCLVLDVRMPGMSGLELQRHLGAIGAILPILFITGHGDVPMAVRAMREGAVDFLQKPFEDQALLDRIQQSLDRDAVHRRELRERRGIVERISRLTSREREVMDLVIAGLANKNVASRLGVSRRTVEIHRARVMEKMGATSLAHLVRMAMTAGE